MSSSRKTSKNKRPGSSRSRGFSGGKASGKRRSAGRRPAPDTEDLAGDADAARADMDFYGPLLRERWGALNYMYRRFQAYAPILEVDVDDGLIKSFPADDYINDLTERTREHARRQYLQSLEDGTMMVFVRDATRRILRSHILTPNDEPADGEAVVKGKQPKGKTKTKKKAPAKGKADRSKRTGKAPADDPSAVAEVARIRDQLREIQARHRRQHPENGKSEQMCCMWSTDDPPDIIEGTEPLEDIEAAFDIEIGEEDALLLYDMSLEQAALTIFTMKKQQG